MAKHDDLTGLPNRRLLKEQFPQMVEETKAKGHLLAVYFIY
ncbi:MULTISPECIES: diguanylate cyclase domain-containing protein [Geobacillus]|uniref:Diguanylate cyclase n=1 Tax=Geobacillus thermodenitrificans TaxID=33940 RepID=A0ABY9QCX8_GEOTD|nr:MULTISPECIES: diguanylate cyclase [Geobacillus]MED3906554.1 diguanylate cyclase [Geobacillus thermodenitrificans]MED4916557.1 diguanylate cyclase [Geobacillus thermodenitrificans]OQP09415.1 hypothetical protein B1691_10860 [Geobacillus sp. 47C-IIb]QNU30289.1 diguanylate cyclase [Geobacillus sp. 47C-IIb]WMV76760.1 diguanylate cyclase [Geobacillus thermodenitrificans]